MGNPCDKMGSLTWDLSFSHGRFWLGPRWVAHVRAHIAAYVDYSWVPCVVAIWV